MNLNSLSTESLLKLLTKYNADYAELVIRGTLAKLEECKKLIDIIHKEFVARDKNNN